MKYTYAFYTNYYGKLVVHNHILGDKELFYGKYSIDGPREIRIVKKFNRSLMVPTGVNKYLRVI